MKPSSLFSLKNISESQYELLAKTIKPELTNGVCLALHGDLGAGKTSFARHVIRQCLNDPELDVPSPTYNLSQHYPTPEGTADIWHYDFYRLENEHEINELGFEDNVESSISIIEWPEKAANLLPDDTLLMHFLQSATHGNRDINFIGNTRWTGLKGSIVKCVDLAPLINSEC